MSVHVEIDLETLGTQPGSVILSIGAVVFDPDLPNDRCIKDEFYCVVSKADSLLHGLSISQDTLDWWKKQSPEAQQVLLDSEDESKSDTLKDALLMLAAFIPVGAKIWSNGANFDQPLLDVAYNKVDVPLPWKYWNSRCHRTLLAMHPNAKSLAPTNALAHNALEDAKYQARHAVMVARALKIKL